MHGGPKNGMVAKVTLDGKVEKAYKFRDNGARQTDFYNDHDHGAGKLHAHDYLDKGDANLTNEDRTRQGL